MNNVQLINALHKLPVPSSIAFGDLRCNRNYFSFKSSTGNLVPLSCCQKHDMECENVELIYNQQSSKGTRRIGSHQREMCK